MTGSPADESACRLGHMQSQSAGNYWDEHLGRQVQAHEPEWNPELFAAAVASNETVRDTIPAPPPVPEAGDEHVVLERA